MLQRRVLFEACVEDLLQTLAAMLPRQKLWVLLGIVMQDAMSE